MSELRQVPAASSGQAGKGLMSVSWFTAEHGPHIVTGYATLRASLSGTFLQTLPDIVTPLKGALSISAQLSTDVVSALRKVRVLISKIINCIYNLC